MRAVLTVFAKEFRDNLRERRTLVSALLVGTLLGPLLLGAILTLTLDRGAQQTENTLALAVAHGERAPQLLAFLRQYGVTARAVGYDDAAARAAVRARHELLVLAVSADFGTRLAAGQPAPLQLYADASDPGTAAD